ncbi:amidohydrolase family protein [Corallococcus sp. M34]|nr:amidohydrolase family protein [Citreicoccus inhibens]
MAHHSTRTTRNHGHKRPHSLATIGAVVMLSSCATRGSVAPAADDTTLFVGKIITLDGKGTIAGAVSVDGRGHIVQVGSAEALSAGRSATAKTITLEPGQVLMPGFIDPHLHLLPTLLQSVLGTHNLAPCLPPPYNEASAETCAAHTDLLGALNSMKVATTPDTAKMFVLGMNLDPSRQAFIPKKCGVTVTTDFMKQPKLYVDACVSKDRPVLILDQSGHLAYVNDKAIAAVCKDKKPCTPPDSVTKNGGHWVTDANGNFTGLIEEAAGYAPFLDATEQGILMNTTIPQGSIKEVQEAIQSLRKAGLTTVADGGLSSRSQLDMVKILAENPNFPLRVTGVVTHLAAAAKEKDHVTIEKELQPTGPTCDPKADPQCVLPKWLGAGAIKLWVDGSTQGCTALLEKPYVYNAKGHCPDANEGQGDFKNTQALVAAMRTLWNRGGWRFQLHANGNQANQWAVEALAQLQSEHVNDHRMLLIHNTVGQESVSRAIGELRKGTYALTQTTRAPSVDVRVTHLIGHVAYWGDALSQMLQKDGALGGGDIDPVAFDRRFDIPFSLHSDSMVTPARPLWFVEQAVTRRTWAYPDFKQTYVLGAEHAMTVDEALRAVTIEPARQHELDKWVGSIEPGKVADFVVLGANPLDFDPANHGDPTQISKIAVIRTYVNGQDTSTQN